MHASFFKRSVSKLLKNPKFESSKVLSPVLENSKPESLKKEIDSLKKKVGSLKNEIVLLKNEKILLEDSNNLLKSRNSFLKNQTELLGNKPIYFVSQSSEDNNIAHYFYGAASIFAIFHVLAVIGKYTSH